MDLLLRRTRWATVAMLTRGGISLHSRFDPAVGYQVPFQSKAVRTIASTHQRDEVFMQCLVDRFGFHVDLFGLAKLVPHRELYVVARPLNFEGARNGSTVEGDAGSARRRAGQGASVCDEGGHNDHLSRRAQRT